FEGVIDLITMKAAFFDGANGENVRLEEIPAEYRDQAQKYRQLMLEGLSMYSEEMMELLLSEEAVPEELVHKVCKEATQSQRITPVFCGSAYKNKGVQLLLDAVARYLPSPLEREIKARKVGNENEKIELKPDNSLPLVGMAFKIVEDPFGQLTFMRIYQGK
ncbi:MAG: elongation factor G, partial [Pirellulaceae bacterium]